MKNTIPKVAITNPDKGGLIAWLFTALNVKLAGGKPYRIQPSTFDGSYHYDAFIIGGGSDIHPSNMTEESLLKTKRSTKVKVIEALKYPMEFLNRFSHSSFDKPRDEMEIGFIEYALKEDKPILGICRGHQLLNAALGGTMYTSTLPLLKNKPRIRSAFPRKKVLYVKDDSLIAKIAGDDPIRVNAIHSQAVAHEGKGLEVTGKETSGINQVIEKKQGNKVLGVQWHPEYLLYMRIHRNIFKWLVNGARNEK
jgi:putative glutamine amidotransferase